MARWKRFIAASLSRGATRLNSSPAFPARVSTVSGRSSRARTTRAAACSGVSALRSSTFSVGTTMAVRTSANRTLVNVTLSAYVSRPAIRDQVSRAVLEARYAANFGAFICTPHDSTLRTCPKPWARIAGSSPRVSRTGPK